jgi:hypothetical protein
MSNFNTIAARAIRKAPDHECAVAGIEISIIDDINSAAQNLPDAAFRMWAFAMTSTTRFGPDHWNTDVFRRDLGFSAAKVSKAARDLITAGYLRRELVNEPGTRGRSSRWFFQTYDEVSVLENELDPTEMTSA